MRTLIASLIAVPIIASASWYNINEQKEYGRIPEAYAGVRPYRSASYRYASDGWRETQAFIAPDGYVTIAGTRRIEMSNDIAYVIYDVQTLAEAEAALQDLKSDELKSAENGFFAIAGMLGLSGKPSFGEVTAALTALQATDVNAAVILSIQLLGVDAEAKREGGNEWWDTASIHEVTP